MPYINCRSDCKVHTHLIQAITRKNLATNIISALNSLLNAQRILKGDEMPGWKSLDECAVIIKINACAMAAEKSQYDISKCQELMRKGCDLCYIKNFEDDLQKQYLCSRTTENFE